MPVQVRPPAPTRLRIIASNNRARGDNQEFKWAVSKTSSRIPRSAEYCRTVSQPLSACSGLARKLSNSRTRMRQGKVANELLYRHDEPRIEIVEQGQPWSFDGDGRMFRLVSEAKRIGLSYSLILCSPYTPRWSNLSHTRSRRSTRRCYPPTASVFACRRSRQRQNDHVRAAGEGTSCSW